MKDKITLTEQEEITVYEAVNASIGAAPGNWKALILGIPDAWITENIMPAVVLKDKVREFYTRRARHDMLHLKVLAAIEKEEGCANE